MCYNIYCQGGVQRHRARVASAKIEVTMAPRSLLLLRCRNFRIEDVFYAWFADFPEVRLLQSLTEPLHHRRKSSGDAVPTEVSPPAVILVVDDEDAVNRLVSRYLTHLGYRVLEACSGDEALVLVRRQRPPIDLVLSDILMPGMDGIALAAQLLARCPGPSVILMTGLLPGEVERMNVNGQLVPVLRKPLNLDQLQDLLRVTLEGFSETESDSVYLAG
jgi:CheY-like chemotaxis protein